MLPPRDEISRLVAGLLPTIEDDYHVEGAVDEEPSMALTVGANEEGNWSYQTGDNSFHGGAYAAGSGSSPLKRSSVPGT